MMTHRELAELPDTPRPRSSTTAAPPPPVAVRQLRALTGLRFLLAAHVVVFHFFPAFAGFPAPLQNLIGSGYVAVPIFFLLSGFILTYTYGAAGGDTVAVGPFLGARFARVYPMYLTGFLCVLGLFALMPGVGSGEGVPPLFNPLAGVAHVFAVQPWFPHLVLTWNLPGWSIGNEFFFYLLFPLFALRLASRWSVRRLVALAAALWLVGNAAPVAYVLLDPDGLGPLAGAGHDAVYSTGFWLNVVKFNPLLRLPEFMIGVALGGIFLADCRHGRRRNGALLAGVGATVMLLVLAGASHIPYPLPHNALLAPAAALLVLGLAHGGGPLAALLASRPLVALGNASYAMYVLQFSLGAPFFAAGIPAIVLARVAAFFLVLIVCSLLAERFLERPARLCLKRLWAGGKGRDDRADSDPPRGRAVVAVNGCLKSVLGAPQPGRV